MSAVLLCDFGSTYTKLTAVDVDEERLLGTASAFTTVATDIGEGFQNALSRLEDQIGQLNFAKTIACSSAAGGLRMMVSGLVPELTAEAARLAALGAGAKVIRVFSHEMTDEDLEEIERVKPEIFLLVGGTDGGNSACILANAELLCEVQAKFPIVVAGNRSCSRRIRKMLEEAGKECIVCPNVMPQLGRIEIHGVQEQIREIFLKEIIRAKGLSRISAMLDNIMMPTPAAAMQALHLLAEGTDQEAGIGDLIAVDLGGATTDIYSIAEGGPKEMNTVLKGLLEPYEKRTVEGDIGMRYSLNGIIEAAGLKRVAELAAMSEERVSELSGELMQKTDTLPETDELKRLDNALASLAVEVAVRRHAGQLEEVYTPIGQAFMQTGKDLREVKRLVVTGGALVLSPAACEIARFAAYRAAEPASLRPYEFEILVDRRYILSTMGLLSTEYPEVALRMLKKELSHE